MATAKTAAVIGLKFEADTGSANKAVRKLEGTIGSFGGRAAQRAQNTAARIGRSFTGGFNQLGNNIASRETEALGLRSALGGLAVTAAAIGLGRLTTNMATAGATAGRMADRLGEPVQRISALQIAAHLAGSSADAMNESLVGLQASVSDAAWGRDNAAFSAFRAAGIDIGDAKRGAKDYLSLLPQIADETQRLARTDVNAAQRWLDQIHVSRDLFPLLRRGSAGLRGFLGDAQSFAPLTPEAVQRMLDADNAMRRLEERIDEFKRMGGAALAPGLTRFMDSLQRYLQDHQQDVQKFFDTIEHGIEYLTTPKNITALENQLNDVVSGIKTMASLAGDLEHNAVVRHILGLPSEGNESWGDKLLLTQVPRILPSLGWGLGAADNPSTPQSLLGRAW